MSGPLFDAVLIANRGEIAVRIVRTLDRLGIRSIAVHSDADADAVHVRRATTAIRIGPAPAAQSYLSVERVLAAAQQTGADAIHPGYGFLSENAAFARAVTAAGLVWIGPPPDAIEAMGDKIRAKQTVAAAGVPVVPGALDPALAADVGYPLMVKASAGGGGKGMRVVRSADDLDDAIAGAKREALASFGDDTILLERFVERPRHIEVQVLADAHGTVLHLHERECSLQRRHQKVIEEAPSPALDATTRRRMGAAAVEAARACGYTGAGTVELIVPGADPATFFFLEMNTRLQVEHPVTEMITGLDLVEQQLRVAAGEPLAFTQSEVRRDGHAIEARVYAEDPARGFLPTGGTVIAYAEPVGVRVDSGIAAGSVIGSDYDPMLAKVVAHGPDRPTALRALRAALAAYRINGVRTNLAFLGALLAHPDVVAGRLDTGLIERELDGLVDAAVPDHALVAAALARLLSIQPDPTGPVDPFDIRDSWRVGVAAAFERRFDGTPVRVRGIPADAHVRVGDADPVLARAVRDGAELVVAVDGTTRRYAVDEADGQVWVACEGRTWALHEQGMLAAARHVEQAAGAGPVLAPMPGTVRVVAVAVGDAVTAGQTLVVVEAMKMEHPCTAPVDGVVAAVHVAVGQQVRMDEALAEVSVQPAGGGPAAAGLES